MRGFTLYEIMTVIGITGLLIVASLPLYSYFQTLTVTTATRQEIIEDLRLVEVRAQNSYNDSAHGIFFSTATYTMYEGASYQTRDQSKDFIKSLPVNISLSGIGDITFQKKTGLPSVSGTLLLTNTATNSQKSISINTQGLIE